MSTVAVTVTASPADQVLPSLSFAALTELGVTSLDPLALTVLVRSYGLDGTPPADAAALAAELGLTPGHVAELQELATGHLCGTRSAPAGADRPGFAELEDDELLADLEAALASECGLDVLEVVATPESCRIVDARELTVLAGVLGVGGALDDDAVAAVAGLDPLTVTAYRLALPDLLTA